VTLDLVPVVEAALASIRPAAGAKAIELRATLGPAARVKGDPDRLEQAVRGLLSNAVKFTPQGGTIEVRVQRTPADLQVVVRDSGMGIAPDLLPQIFEPSWQAADATRRRHGGLGLGLTIVRGLLDLHGGAVSAESAGEGKGATFILSVPAVDPQPSEAAAPGLARDQAGADDSASLKGLRVLVVEDDPDTRALIEMILLGYEARVETAGSAKEALEQLGSFRPDVILSDIGMPDEDGYDLIRQVRGLESAEGGAIPAAALTAFARAEDRRRALEAGFQMHVPKPIAPNDLFKVVATLAGSHRIHAARAAWR
jgi:CheY-like chemotaxis protein